MERELVSGSNCDQEQNLAPSKGDKSLLIPTRSPFWSFMNEYWVWEVISCIGSLVALICIMGVLLNYDRKPIPNWPYGITINSVLSWITQVFSAFMLGTVAACLSQNAWIHFNTRDRPLSNINSYHSASRGVWGCMIFLWEVKMRHWASLGCLITILAVGVGPFVQQMSTVRNTRVPVNLPATVGRGQTYTETPSVSVPLGSLSGGMLAALYSNLFQSLETTKVGGSSSASYPNIPVTCPSGECDFPVFRSLAACSECYDFSSSLNSHCENGASCLPENKTQCLHSLPNGMQANMSDFFSFGEVFHRMNSTPPTLEMGRQAKLQDYGLSKILGLTEIRIPSDSVVSNAIASYCVLYWCVNTYSAAVRAHNLNETVLDTWHDPIPPLHGGGPETQLYLRPPEKDNLTQNTFIVNKEVSRQIRHWLESKMITSNLLVTNCYGGKAGMGQPMRDPSEFEEPMLRCNLTDVFRSLANGVTTRVRQLDWSAQNDTSHFSPVERIGAVNGTSFMMETQIDVKWAWIVLPSLLLVITMLFTGVTVRNTKRMGLEAWKSSPTALICSGLDEDIQQEIRAARDPVDMENLTAGIPVHLRKCNTDAHGDYWKLVQRKDKH